ncbi:hypothetical protein JXM83_02740 [Candidatus Woesearchaeota archaeon]|nr:hypothetical protein [Candidatus Woesearchaeota archaeon]
MSEFTTKPSVPKRIGMWVLFSLVGLSLFAIIYNFSVDTAPKSILENVVTKTYDYASPESVDSMFTGIKSTCESLTSQLNKFGINFSRDEETVRKDAQKAGLNQEDLNYFISLYELCEKTDESSKEFILSASNNLIFDKLNLTDDTQMSDLVENAANTLPVSSGKTLQKIIPIINIFSSTGKLFALLLICLIIGVILCINYMEYFLTKLANTIIGVGTGLVLPFVGVKLYLLSNPIDTSFLYEAISKAFTSNLVFNFSSIISKIQTAIIGIMLEILYPLRLLAIGVIVIALGVGILILIKSLSKKGVFNSDA